jgi:hypothetical protein
MLASPLQLMSIGTISRGQEFCGGLQSNQTDGSGAAGAEPAFPQESISKFSFFHWVQSDWIAERRPNSRQELNQSLMNHSRTIIVSFTLNLLQPTN